MTPIAPHITAFLRQRLAVDRRASPQTCDTYAYAFQLLFRFMSDALRMAPADLALEHLDAPLVLRFLDHLQQARHNTPRIGRVLIATGLDATDVAITTSFGRARLAHFKVTTDEIALEPAAEGTRR